MFTTFNATRLAVIAFLAIGAHVFGAENTPAAGGDAKTAAATTGEAKTAAAKEKSKKALSTAELKKLIDELNKQRDTMLDNYEALQKQFKEATEEKKQEIKEKIEAQKKAFDEVTAALHRQIRDEQRRQRANGAGPKR